MELTKGRIYKYEDKPDIITRVFRLKVIDMLAFIKSGKPFGQTIAGPLSFISFLLNITTFYSYYDCLS
jgi:hypothetical protein